MEGVESGKGSGQRGVQVRVPARDREGEADAGVVGAISAFGTEDSFSLLTPLTPNVSFTRPGGWV